MANRYTKRWSTLLLVTEMKIKTTMIYHLTPIRMAIIKKKRNNEYWQGCGNKGTLVHLCTVGGNVNWCSHYGKQSVLKKNFLMIQQLHFWVFMQRKGKH